VVCPELHGQLFLAIAPVVVKWSGETSDRHPVDPLRPGIDSTAQPDAWLETSYLGDLPSDKGVRTHVRDRIRHEAGVGTMPRLNYQLKNLRPGGLVNTK
jgi:hypothetical protein